MRSPALFPRVILFGLSGTIAVLTAASTSASASGDPPLVVVLAETGRVRDGLPVLERDASGDAAERALLRGFSLRLLKLYRMNQAYLQRRDARGVEPAYLLLSSRQGGFPGEGFYLGEVPKRGVGYVDLHRSQPLTGSFGADDQIFPHELAHVILRQLAGPPREGGANQIHAIGVRTDPATAFDEGFAEHMQLMAIEDPDAAPETRALTGDERLKAWAGERLSAYDRALSARWAFAPRARMTFPLWFSRAEQILRYYAVKENLFALERSFPEHRLTRDSAYEAYLFENVLPGSPGGRRKETGRLLSTEGVISALFYRWVGDPTLQGDPAGVELGSLFLVEGRRIDGLDRAYLKLFHAMASGKPADTADLVRAYGNLFPEDEPAVDRLTREVLGDPLLHRAPQIWLSNPDFATGTTLFDQFRGLPREHTFDLNAAALADLIAVPGVDRELARAIREHAPFDSLAALQHVAGVSAGLMQEFERMAARMSRSSATPNEVEAVLSLESILLPYLWRALGVWLIGAGAAATLYYLVRRVSWWRAVINGLAAALVGLAAGWFLDPGHGLLAFLTPVLLPGVTASVWQLAVRRQGPGALRVLAAWAAAALPGAVLVRPWG